MVELLVVRHGQSIADLEDRFEGRADFEFFGTSNGYGNIIIKWRYWDSSLAHQHRISHDESMSR